MPIRGCNLCQLDTMLLGFSPAKTADRPYAPSRVPTGKQSGCVAGAADNTLPNETSEDLSKVTVIFLMLSENRGTASRLRLCRQGECQRRRAASSEFEIHESPQQDSNKPRRRLRGVISNPYSQFMLPLSMLEWLNMLELRTERSYTWPHACPK